MPHASSKNTGGGSTFVRNLKDGVSDDIQFVNSLDEAQILFIPGVTLCSRPTFREAIAKEKLIVTRVDNIPEDHRNRGTGIPRLRDFAEQSHFVIFQSEWSKHVVGQITGEKGVVIYNGVDTKIFYPDESQREDKPTFIYVKHSRNECKRFQEAQVLFREYARSHEAKLIVVGKFSDDIVRYNLGFYDGEDVEFLGILNHLQLAEQYRRAHALIFPSFGDSCPNVVLEAMASGCRVLHHPWGGTAELVGSTGPQLRYGKVNTPSTLMYDAVEYVKEEMGTGNPRERVMENFTLEKMVEQYEGIFKLCVR